MSDWLADRACADVSTAVFFPERGDRATIVLAKSICSRCPVSSECLDAAINNSEKEGIWGGLSPKERRKVRATRPRRIVCEGCGGPFFIPPHSRGGIPRYCSAECRRAASAEASRRHAENRRLNRRNPAA